LTERVCELGRAALVQGAGQVALSSAIVKAGPAHECGVLLRLAASRDVATNCGASCVADDKMRRGRDRLHLRREAGLRIAAGSRLWRGLHRRRQDAMGSPPPATRWLPTARGEFRV